MPLTPTKLQGYKAHIATVSGSPAVATQIASLQEVDVTIKLDKIDATDHDNVGWKSALPGLAEWTATAKFLYVDSDVTQETLRTAMLAGTQLNFAFFPQVLTGAPSFTGSGYITSFKWGGKNSDAQALDITIDGFGPLLEAVQA